MTRAYDEWIAAVFDVVPARLVLLGLFLITLVGAVLWYSFPAWVPRRWPRLRMPRIDLRLPRRRTRRRPAAREAGNQDQILRPTRVRDHASPIGPDADRLAAEGRYAEAIRQRLRDTVADLTRAGVVSPQPGSTAAELAGAAAGARPGVAPAMDAATELFSEVWYGHRPARAEHDERMRRLTDEVRGDAGGPR
ncbi:DUF4129 domain-containing protein [Actinoplanes sp. NPDC023936]|uniref:DUF4129 domain-containing protein n=1 Tax=Actinoplanes sp. NPDC023936 TaxID=3154910 RepID=UPI0033C5F513